MKRKVKGPYRDIVLHVWDNFVECVPSLRPAKTFPPLKSHALPCVVRLSEGVQDIIIIGHGTGCEVRSFLPLFLLLDFSLRATDLLFNFFLLPGHHATDR